MAFRGGIKVVARFRDGRVIKGTTQDFFPTKTVFHFHPNDEGAEVMAVVRDDLKALFFVKSFDGDPARVESDSFERAQGMGRKVRVRFYDGETIAGFTSGYQPGRPGFFLFPADRQSNNERVFVVAKAVDELAWV